jgi:hypothetical protein
VSDQIQLLIGATPWLPSAESELVEEYAHYDMPTVGVISQYGCYFLFECVEGVVDNFNIWVYAPITKKEEEELSQLTGSELTEAIDAIWGSRDLTAAIAEGDAILTGGPVVQATVKRLGVTRAALNALHTLVKGIDAASALEPAV